MSTAFKIAPLTLARTAGLAALLVAAAPLWACSGDDSSPESTVRAFLDAVAMVEPDRAYQLLAPETQQDLVRLADTATQHTGGRHKLKPRDLILLGLAQPLHERAHLELMEESDTRAKVRLLSGDNPPAREDLTLVKDAGHWRILLELKPAP